MKRQAFFFIAALFAACATAPPPVERSLQPNLTPGSARVVMVSFDGVGADDLQRMHEQGAVGNSGYFHLVEHGLSAARVIPVNPTLTASAHLTIATGTTADKHGIVSNAFHLPGTPNDQWTSGYSAPITAETIWEAARRQGKQVGIVCFPGADGKDERRRGDWGLAWPEPLARSRIQKLTRADFTAEWLPPGWRATTDGSFSPILHARAAWSVNLGTQELTKQLVISAYDTTDDARENYDKLAVRDGATEIPIERQWFAISGDLTEAGETYRAGSWSKILSIDPSLNEVTIYWGSISRSIGYPASYRRMIDEKVGFWPSAPDERLAAERIAGKGGIDPEIFSEQVNRFSEFLTRATIFSMQQMPWDLVISYQPIIDETEHQWRLQNPRQANFTESNRTAAARVRAAAFQAFDRAVNTLAAAVDFQTTNLVITSDHGHADLDTQVAMARLLADWGYARIVDDRTVADSAWLAFTSGHVANLYRFGGAPADNAELMRRLRELRSPDGDPVFEEVREKTAADHPNGGDIVATAFPRFYMSSSARNPIFQKTSHYGQHGGLNTHPEFHTIFAAAGSRVVPRKVPVVQQTEIARYVASLLGIAPPADAR